MEIFGKTYFADMNFQLGIFQMGQKLVSIKVLKIKFCKYHVEKSIIPFIEWSTQPVTINSRDG